MWAWERRSRVAERAARSGGRRVSEPRRGERAARLAVDRNAAAAHAGDHRCDLGERADGEQ